MAKWQKALDGMRNNPAGDWTIEDFEVVARHYSLNLRRPGGSHVTISHPLIDRIITPPAKRPIKAFYVRQFVDFVDDVAAAGEE